MMGMPVIKASNTKRKQAITDIIESVALEETALAHILNAEGEELQKIICMDRVNPAVLIQANESVRSMIDTITKFEIVLESKCEIFKDCLCIDDRRYNYDDDDYNDDDDDDCECEDD